jgi:hypothetical protein
MTDPSGFPLFNRIVVAVTAGGLLLGILVGLTVPAFRAEIDIANGFVIVVFAVIAAGGLWLSLTWKDRTGSELAEESARDSFGQPEISEGARVFHFPVMSKAGAVYLDEEAGQIHFHNCHVPRKFLASEEEWFSCPLDELKGVHVFRYRGESITVITPQGKVMIHDYGRNFAELRDLLKELVPKTTPGFSADHPMMGMVYLGGALAGLFGGVIATPRNATDSTMGLFVLCGSILGVAGVHAVVVLADRKLKVGLAQPLGFGVTGVCAGIALAQLLGPLAGWRMSVTLAAVLIGGMCGATFGIWNQIAGHQDEE